jgi:hypothetical protein
VLAGGNLEIRTDRVGIDAAIAFDDDRRTAGIGIRRARPTPFRT